MAKGRMLNKKICLDEKVNQLPCDTARLLFTWMIAHLDQNGCFYGDPGIVKNLVFPRRNDLKVSKVAQFLDEMETLGLIQRYKVDGELYLSFPSFEKNQPGLRKEREAKSDIPIPKIDGMNPTICRSNDGNTPLEQNRSITEQNTKGFPALKEGLNESTNKIGFLVTTFKELHSNAPPEDFTDTGGRLAGIAKTISNDYGFLLQIIWDTASKSINGSHLNYIQGVIKGRNAGIAKSRPSREYEEPDEFNAETA